MLGRAKKAKWLFGENRSREQNGVEGGNNQCEEKHDLIPDYRWLAIVTITDNEILPDF